MTTKTTTSFDQAKKLYREAMQSLNEQRHPGFRGQIKISIDPQGYWSDKTREQKYADKINAISADNHKQVTDFLEKYNRTRQAISDRHEAALAARENATDPHIVAMLRDEYRSTLGRIPATDRPDAIEHEITDAVRRGDVNRVRALRIEGADLMKNTGRSPLFLDRAWDELLPEDVRNAPAEISELESMRYGLNDRALEVEGILTDGATMQGRIVNGDFAGEPSPIGKLFSEA